MRKFVVNVVRGKRGSRESVQLRWPRITMATMATFLLLALPAHAATPIVADISNYRIAMDSSFNGTRLFLFGARNDPGDVVVIVRGPNKNYIMRQKEPVAGIWINSDRMKFYQMPSFYALAASKPLGNIEQGAIFKQLGIGEDHLFAAMNTGDSPSRFGQFKKAFLRYQTTKNLYANNLQPLSFMGETLFKTVVDFPDNIPPGIYTAEIYLLSDGELAGMQSMPITVVKSGLDAFLYDTAHRFPALYGLAAIALALTVGWLGSRLFERT